jgi:hypothetical protein
MTFDKKYLNEYKTLIKTTDLQKGYQEFIKLFRYLRIELEKELVEYRFSSNIVENNMDYSYFQLVNDSLKKLGIKIQVVFKHKEFRFEIWASGYNRQIQNEYYQKLKNKELPYILNDQPSRIDYILRFPLDENLDLSDEIGIKVEINRAIKEFVQQVNKILEKKW